uniref:ABC transporter n=1 Tax=Marseillevirus LCMAC101 TaxID=2506602 RepID=A0A481YSF9_9VIRU|nr:MAG: ABC transporter [Marseillevirus LCMAC101]
MILQKMTHAKSVWDRIPTSKYPPVPVFNFSNSHLKDPTAVIKIYNVSFGYSPPTVELENLDLALYIGDKIGLIGKNGSGKSTFLKLLDGTLRETGGNIERRNGLKIVRFHQHHIERFDLDLSPVELFHEKFRLSSHDSRCYLGRFGLRDKLPLCKIRDLSGGQKMCLAMAELSYSSPDVILLDEPTNHLDMETIKSLAEGIKKFEGAVIIVSHNQYFLNNVTTALWIADKKKIKYYEGDLAQYKKEIKDQLGI